MDSALSGNETAEYCREIETYLCQKNEGHLIRVVGPSFELVSGWAAQGVPLKIAFNGIDRYFERYYRQGPAGSGRVSGRRRRPIRIDFCDADVLDAFDEWRRAVGLAAIGGPPAVDEEVAGPKPSSSLPSHLERVVRRLTAARVSGTLGDAFDGLIDNAARELDAARASARGLRGGPRQALLSRLEALDAALLRAARDTLDAAARAALDREADEELAAYRARMAPDAFARARDAALDRLVRERFGLPTVAFQ